MAKRKTHTGNYTLLKIVICIAIVLLALLYPSHQERGSIDNNDRLGMELAIPQFTKSTKSQVIEHIGYTVSYNEQRRNPNWVAYKLTAEEVDGTEPRDSKFIPDPKVIGRQAVDDDYKHSGWDRGHLAPAADMKWSEQAMDESFYLSNISPQNGNLNRGVWKSIEELTRDNAQRYGEILVVTGPVFTSKKGLGYIGDNRVLIPNAFYKVLLTYNNGYKGIGFYCENIAGKKKLQTYVKSIDEIEEITGIDFFHLLPDEIEDGIEAIYDWNDWKTAN